jgi:tetratricopeptide (TPR) repeat protein
LGTLLFSKGLNDAGMGHWLEAKQLAPHLPVLDVDMGDAYLKVKADPQRALISFREALQNDNENAEAYVGLDEALSLLGASASERSALLSQYPSADDPKSKMPASLVYQLALTRAEAGQFEQASALFKDRFFPSEEGGITSGQVLSEIELMQAEEWAKTQNCSAAEGFLRNEPDGRSSRGFVKLAGIARRCNNAQESERLLKKAVAGAESGDLAWAIQAEKSLGTYDVGKAQERVENSLAAIESRAETSVSSGSLWYGIGLLQAALNHNQQAREAFGKALALPDTHLSHHLAREGLAAVDANK